ncbi:hypothetical protein KI688_003170 [Linnemannia hyalina]|uniref:NACHT domain-containing protein n=1 Tax=Linnemannia hyalina TaxID=64524 RepID=A0A9P7XQQ0_9FUNG|nr:hypothetical protein KI688_003170 [Linnemannia hyalina]
MIILGDSESGKLMFSLRLEQQLWHNFDNNIIPLHIILASVHEPVHDMINKQLRMHGFTKSEIQELKKHYGFILICDGYDERQQFCNLYTTNLLTRPHQWRAKMVISCRNPFLGPNYEHLFAPLPSNHYRTAPADIFQQAVIVPFSKEQVKDYVVQYTALHSRPWTVEDYLQVLGSIPDLLDLVTNPFTLTLALEALPGVIEDRQDLSAIRLQWFVINLQRLQASVLSSVDRETLNWLLDVDFISKGIDYSTGLATAMFDIQDGIPVVKYVHVNDKGSWRGGFFGPQPIVRLLRESSPLTRAGTSHRFLPRSLQGYFFSLAIFDPRNRGSQDEFDPFSRRNSSTAQLLNPNNPLFKHNLVIEPFIIDFLCERVKQIPDFQEQLPSIIHQSTANNSTARGASNAMTVLVKAGVHFNCADLQVARIPHAGITASLIPHCRKAPARDGTMCAIWVTAERCNH